MNLQVPTGIKPGITVLIDGTKYQARGLLADGRMFVNPINGDELYLTGAQQRRLAAEYRLVIDDLPKNIEEGIARARAADFATYDVVQRTIALRRLQYVREVHELPAPKRRRKKEIQKCILTVHARLIEQTTTDFSHWITDENDADKPTAEIPIVGAGLVPDLDADARVRASIIEEKLQKLIERDTRVEDPAVPVGQIPTPRSVRRWYRMYFSSGQDIRVLLNHHANKGNSTPRYEEWVMEAVEKIIDENVAVPTPAKYSKVLDLACQAVEDARKPDQQLPDIATSHSGEKLLGKNLIARWVRQRNRFELATTQLGIYEARRRFKEVELGPQGDYPNNQWEVDHTVLDLFVIDEDAQHVHGRPWLTVIMDRHSRCIVGFSLSFAPASWISVTDALRIAIADKSKLLAFINSKIEKEKYRIKESWDCYGIPGWLVTDHGREFKSKSMDQTLAILNTKPMQTKKRKPWLKGKVERWFRTFQEEFVHTVPGTTFSKFEKRKFYKSEEFAVVTLPELNWMVLKWVVDVYNQRPHGKLRLSPAEVWRRGVKQDLTPRELPAELLRPVMGLVLDRTLGLNGVRFAGMRWDSSAFARLREKFKGESGVVQVRLDPRDLSKIYAWDEYDDRWVTAHLIEPKEAANYSLDQWYYIDTRRKELMQTQGLSKAKAVQQAIADIQDFIREIANSLSSSKAYKRYLVNVHRHRSAWEMLLADEWDPENDVAPAAHQLGPSPMLATMRAGPFREPPHPAVEDSEYDGGSSSPHGPQDASPQATHPEEPDRQAALAAGSEVTSSANESPARSSNPASAKPTDESEAMARNSAVANDASADRLTNGSGNTAGGYRVRRRKRNTLSQPGD